MNQCIYNIVQKNNEEIKKYPALKNEVEIKIN